MPRCAPFDGVIGERIANQGESLPIDGKILALLDTSHAEVEAQMPAADVVRLKVDQPTALTVDGFGERVSNGRITRISPTTQAGSRLIPVYVEVTDRYEGCAADCSPPVLSSCSEKAHALAVPASAMRKDDEGDFVLAVVDGVLVRKPVGVVRTWSRGELVEVKSLESGMTIVSAPLPASRRAIGPGH